MKNKKHRQYQRKNEFDSPKREVKRQPYGTKHSSDPDGEIIINKGAIRSQAKNEIRKELENDWVSFQKFIE